MAAMPQSYGRDLVALVSDTVKDHNPPVMKLNSKYFDSIRVSKDRGTKGRGAKAAAKERSNALCQWKGCDKRGSHRAPKGRGRDGEYYLFCLDHVRQYNASYNYFEGMNDKDFADYQRDSLTGHRPTWKMGSDKAPEEAKPAKPKGADAWTAEARMKDPHGFFAWRAKQARKDAQTKRREVRPLEKKALASLHLDVTASKEEIKAKFKELAKKHHPDTNGGDRATEEKLREVIQAYNYLKQVGLV